MLDVCPRRDDGAENHETKGEEGQARNGAAEPKNFAVGDYDDSQILKDGVDRYGEELESFGAGINHADQEKGDGKP